MSGIDWLWESARKLRKQYEQITAEKGRGQRKRIFHPDLTEINSRKSVIIKQAKTCTNLIPYITIVSSFGERGDFFKHGSFLFAFAYRYLSLK